MSSFPPSRPEDAIVRVFCVDDHAIFLEGLRAFFGLMAAKGEKIAFAGSAQDSQTGFSQISLVRPDILLLDVWLSRRPGFTGLDLLRKLRRHHIDIPVLAYSGSLLSETQLLDFLALDLDGFLLKDGNPQNILAAVLEVMAGNSFFCPEIEPLFQRLRAKLAKDVDGFADLPFHLLSQQERTVLQSVLQGVPRKDIAESLNITRSSIDTYRRRILQKLGIQDFAELDIPQTLKQLSTP
ncbi:MAG: hypothetical protein CVV27_16910 [Candidatus Melainabacteria bacterium HGW-Melainabacteria-1]|nr:MAG: hypothetical protein CVV27_16910 [Candidatus Melainabacteria bacterium HGW-Melainabacteria-1]